MCVFKLSEGLQFTALSKWTYITTTSEFSKKSELVVEKFRIPLPTLFRVKSLEDP